MTPPEDLDRDDIAAAALATGKTWDEAAAAAGCSRSTIARLERNPEFRKRVSDIRARIVDQAVSVLVTSLADAFAQIALISSDGDKEENRLRASGMIAELLLRFRREGDLEERMRRIEEASAKPAETPGASGTGDHDADGTGGTS